MLYPADPQDVLDLGPAWRGAVAVLRPVGRAEDRHQRRGRVRDGPRWPRTASTVSDRTGRWPGASSGTGSGPTSCSRTWRSWNAARCTGRLELARAVRAGQPAQPDRGDPDDPSRYHRRREARYLDVRQALALLGLDAAELRAIAGCGCSGWAWCLRSNPASSPEFARRPGRDHRGRGEARVHRAGGQGRALRAAGRAAWSRARRTPDGHAAAPRGRRSRRRRDRRRAGRRGLVRARIRRPCTAGCQAAGCGQRHAGSCCRCRRAPRTSARAARTTRRPRSRTARWSGRGIGCHAGVLMPDPKRVGTVIGLTQMGGEGAQWIGMGRSSRQRTCCRTSGDGTFHHSGSLAVRAAVAAGVNVTFKLLYNSAVAMTGGQQAVGSDAGARSSPGAAGRGRAARSSSPPTTRPVSAGPAWPRGAEVRHRDQLAAGPGGAGRDRRASRC